ncbi:hypothetical protein CCP2SC5_130009 [Azospirillaceae bacterium]
MTPTAADCNRLDQPLNELRFSNTSTPQRRILIKTHFKKIIMLYSFAFFPNKAFCNCSREEQLPPQKNSPPKPDKNLQTINNTVTISLFFFAHISESCKNKRGPRTKENAQ